MASAGMDLGDRDSLDEADFVVLDEKSLDSIPSINGVPLNPTSIRIDLPQMAGPWPERDICQEMSNGGEDKQASAQSSAEHNINFNQHDMTTTGNNTKSPSKSADGMDEYLYCTDGQTDPGPTNGPGDSVIGKGGDFKDDSCQNPASQQMCLSHPPPSTVSQTQPGAEKTNTLKENQTISVEDSAVTSDTHHGDAEHTDPQSSDTLTVSRMTGDVTPQDVEEIDCQNDITEAKHNEAPPTSSAEMSERCAECPALRPAEASELTDRVDPDSSSVVSSVTKTNTIEVNANSTTSMTESFGQIDNSKVSITNISESTQPDKATLNCALTCDSVSVETRSVGVQAELQENTCERLTTCDHEIHRFHDKIVVKLYEKYDASRNGRCCYEAWYRKPGNQRWYKATFHRTPQPFAVMDYLDVATQYEILLHSWGPHGSGEAISIYCTTLKAGPPDQFIVLRNPGEETVMFTWNPPTALVRGASVRGYTLYITTLDPLEASNYNTEVRYLSYDKFADQALLEPNNSYRFALHADVGGEISPPARAELVLYKHQLLRKSTKLPTQGKPIFQVPLSETPAPIGTLFRTLELGTMCHANITEKVILVIGATGAGKTTLINSLINYVMGVKYSDEFRFKLVSEPPNADQSKSQTSHISSYTLHFQDGFKVDYTLTIVDTPGFGDTDGIARDKEVAKELYNFFKSDHGRMDHLDAVGFVSPASHPRLTPTQTYIFDSVLSLFGKDIAQSIYLLLTFADGKPPQILSAIKASKFPYRSHFKFNNSAVFDDIGSTAGEAEQNRDDSSDEDEDEDEGEFDEMFWNIGMKSFEKFLKKICRGPATSLKLTKDVLEQRARIELYIEELHQQVTQGLFKQEQLIREQDLLKRHDAQMHSNKNFTYQVWEAEVVKLPIPNAETNTTCLQCNYTCHKQCVFDNDTDKHRCSAMDRSTKPVTCRICPGHCVWDVHKNTKYHYVTKQVLKWKTSSDLKARYEKAQGAKLSTQQIVNAIWEEFDGIQGHIIYAIYEIRESLSILDDIALKDNPLSTVEYIDILIQSEMQEAQPGWQIRVKHLNGLRLRAQQLHEIAKGDYDPFRDYRDRIEEARGRGMDFRDKESWTQVAKKYKIKFQSKFKDNFCAVQ